MKADYKGNSAEAQILLDKWNEKSEKVRELGKEMLDIQKEIEERFSPYKVGDILKEKDTGKEHCISSIKVLPYLLDKNNTFGVQKISFDCATKLIKKDGSLSTYNSCIWREDEVEPTGRHIDL